MNEEKLQERNRDRVGRIVTMIIWSISKKEQKNADINLYRKDRKYSLNYNHKEVGEVHRGLYHKSNGEAKANGQKIDHRVSTSSHVDDTLTYPDHSIVLVTFAHASHIQFYATSIIHISQQKRATRQLPSTAVIIKPTTYLNEDKMKNLRRLDKKNATKIIQSTSVQKFRMEVRPIRKGKEKFGYCYSIDHIDVCVLNKRKLLVRRYQIMRQKLIMTRTIFLTQCHNLDQYQNSISSINMAPTTRSKTPSRTKNSLKDIMDEQQDMNIGFKPASEFSRSSKKFEKNAERERSLSPKQSHSSSPKRCDDNLITSYLQVAEEVEIKNDKKSIESIVTTTCSSPHLSFHPRAYR